MNSALRDRLLASTIIAGMMVVAGPAFAQDASAPAAPAQATTSDQSQPTGATVAPIEGQTGAAASADATGAPAGDSTGGEIIVTGSRIPQPNLTSASPVTVLNSQDAKLQGVTRVEDLVNSLPQAFASQTGAVSNGSSGTATLNLRNLGDQRTLVLINGRRLGPGDPSAPTADLNFIPTALIKRVDVLTGGASSVYGSDAVAGVANFVMDTDYTGVGVDTEYGVYQHNNDSRHFQQLNKDAGYPVPAGNTVDGRTFDITLKVGTGTSDGRGHIVAYAGYRKIAAVAESERDYSACGFGGNATGDDFSCLTGGSGTAYPATFTLGDGSQYHPGANGEILAGRNLYNANPTNYYQRPDKRYTAGFFAHYDVSDAFKTYGEFGFMDDRTNAVIAPSGDFQNTSTINCNNPFLSAAQSAVICAPGNLLMNDDGTPTQFLNPDGSTYTRANLYPGRRNVEGGGRDADFRHTQYRFVAGARGEIAKGVSYDVYGQFGDTQLNEIYRNEFSVNRLTRAIDVIRGADGTPVCRSVVDGSDPACVPYNIFSTDPQSADAINYLEVPGFQEGETKEKIVSGSVTFLGGDYGLKSPFADDGIGLNVGAEYREESLRLEVDNEFATGDLAGQGGPTLPISGAFNVKEVFAELHVPLVSDKPFFQELSLDGGYRYSDYNLSGGVSSYKLQATWAPVRDIKLRGGYNRAVRAANIQELFLAQSVQIDGATDPCSGASPEFTQAQCALQGVSAAQYGHVPNNPAAQYNGLVGGNPNLTPEKADTYTAGVVLQPSFLPGFNASVDAFYIKLKNRIVPGIGADVTLTQCGLTGQASFCDLIHRDAVGSLFLSPNGYVIDTNLNLGSLTTKGIDTNVSYTMRTDGAGTFGFSLAGTYLDEFISNVPPAKYDCAGYYGPVCGTPAPKWRHKARVTWDSPWGIGLSGQWRYFGHVSLDKTSSDDDLAGAYNAVDAHIKAQSYFDLTATARLGDKLNLRAGVDNIFDKRPPILTSSGAPIGSFGNGNTYSTVYDALGRFGFVGLSFDL